MTGAPSPVTATISAETSIPKRFSWLVNWKLHKENCIRPVHKIILMSVLPFEALSQLENVPRSWVSSNWCVLPFLLLLRCSEYLNIFIHFIIFLRSHTNFLSEKTRTNILTKLVFYIGARKFVVFFTFWSKKLTLNMKKISFLDVFFSVNLPEIVQNNAKR